MLISIESCKGGTGKTTVATNFALSLDRNVTLLDCDVEEPNDHLFKQTELGEHQLVTTLSLELKLICVMVAGHVWIFVI